MFKHFRSRKFAFAAIGTVAMLSVFTSSVVLIVINPVAAPHIVQLANLAIVFLGSVTGVMLGGQSFVDWKHGSESQLTTSSKTEYHEEHTEVKIEQNIEMFIKTEGVDAPLMKPYAGLALEEGYVE